MSDSDRFHRFAIIMLAALLILLISLLHAQVYGQRNYREDEINTVHAALRMTPAEITRWMAGDVHPPGWRLLADLWLDAFGVDEALARWSSKLINLLTFALVFQLGCQLLDGRLGLFALAILGVYGFAGDGMYELRPYAMLIALTTALHLVYYRWLKRPGPRLMVIYAALGMAAMYTHLVAVFIFPAHALFMALFRRPARKHLLDSLLMWAGIALAFSVWLPPLLGVMLGPFAGGYYAHGFGQLLERAHFRPAVIFGFLLLLSILTPRLLEIRPERPDGFRLYRHWQLLYPLFLLLSTIAIAALFNLFYSSLSYRGLLALTPLIALLMALGLRLLPLPAGVILIALLLLGAPQNIKLPTSNGPYREIAADMTATYQRDSLLLTEFEWAWRWLTPAAYFLMDFTPDQMSKARMYHIVGSNDSAHPPTYPDALQNVQRTFAASAFDAGLPAHQQLWLLRQGDGNRFGAAIQAWLDGNYAHIRSSAWGEPYETAYALSEYARAPASRETILRAGDHLRLSAWSLLPDVNVAPCAAVTLESWWQLAQADKTPYTLSIILADSDGDGQLAITNAVPANVFTSDWRPDKFYRDRSALQVPCDDIESGSYDLLLAIKETISGDDLPLSAGDGSPIGDVFYLTTLHVSA